MTQMIFLRNVLALGCSAGAGAKKTRAQRKTKAKQNRGELKPGRNKSDPGETNPPGRNKHRAKQIPGETTNGRNKTRARKPPGETKPRRKKKRANENTGRKTTRDKKKGRNKHGRTKPRDTPPGHQRVARLLDWIKRNIYIYIYIYIYSIRFAIPHQPIRGSIDRSVA